LLKSLSDWTLTATERLSINFLYYKTALKNLRFFLADNFCKIPAVQSLSKDVWKFGD